MMAVPKRKNCHARSSKRWAGYTKPKLPALVLCPNCQEMMQAHHVCRSCGYYNGREVVKAEEE
jgi:large subunit ribosomal protein L32